MNSDSETLSVLSVVLGAWSSHHESSSDCPVFLSTSSSSDSEVSLSTSSSESEDSLANHNSMSSETSVESSTDGDSSDLSELSDASSVTASVFGTSSSSQGNSSDLLSTSYFQGNSSDLLSTSSSDSEGSLSSLSTLLGDSNLDSYLGLLSRLNSVLSNASLERNSVSLDLDLKVSKLENSDLSDALSVLSEILGADTSLKSSESS